MKILDNVNLTVKGDLQETMKKGSKVSIASACFSIYAYNTRLKWLKTKWSHTR